MSLDDGETKGKMERLGEEDHDHRIKLELNPIVKKQSGSQSDSVGRSSTIGFGIWRSDGGEKCIDRRMRLGELGLLDLAPGSDSGDKCEDRRRRI